MYRFSVLSLIAVFLCCSKSMGNPIDGEMLNLGPSPLVKYKMPSSCKGQTFCFEKGDNYPDDLVDKFLKTLPLQDHFGTKINFGFRGGDRENGNVDCPANTTYTNKPIYYVFDELGIVRVVIQSPEKFEQLYSARWCLNEGIITRDTPHFFPESIIHKNFQVECVTTHMAWDFIVLVEEFGDPTFKIVKSMGGIPVCCRCQYHSKKKQQ